MSILAKMGDWQVRGFALAGAEVGGGGGVEGAGKGEAERKSLGPGQESRKRGTPGSAQESSQERKGRKNMRCRRARSGAKSGTRSTGGPGGHLWFALRPLTPPLPTRWEQGRMTNSGGGRARGGGCSAG